MPAKHLLIKGKVQGVFYRASAKEVADKLGLAGWIKNTEEGHVEALASGGEKEVEAFITWCRQGPAGARVTSIVIENATGDIPKKFHIIRG